MTFCPVAFSGQLVGEHATRVQRTLRDRLAADAPEFEWSTEYRVGSTPVDVAGTATDRTVLVELEWRRADPADNAAKLFRHLDGSTLGTGGEAVVVCQLFTDYYDLASGGVSAKRHNAEFVGQVAADALDRLTYHPLDVPISPPKRGGELPADWRDAVTSAADAVLAVVES